MGTDFPSINPNVGIPKIITNGAENFVPVPSSNGGIGWKILLPATVAGVTGLGLGLKNLFSSNNPERMATENNSTSTETPSKPKSKQGFWGNSYDYVKCTLQEWLSEGTDECAAFLHRSKKEPGIGSWFGSLASTVQTLLIAGFTLPVVTFLLKGLFDRYASTGSMTTIQPTIAPQIQPNIDPRIDPNINPTINPTINPEINPKINPTINPNITSNVDNEYEPDYNPNLMQNYVTTINVMRENKQPQIVIQPKGHVFVPYEPGYKSKPKIKNKNIYSWLYNNE